MPHYTYVKNQKISKPLLKNKETLDREVMDVVKKYIDITSENWFYKSTNCADNLFNELKEKVGDYYFTVGYLEDNIDGVSIVNEEKTVWYYQIIPCVEKNRKRTKLIERMLE